MFSDTNMSESPESFLMVLSSPTNATIDRGEATGTILIVAQTSQILISEVRTGSGPAGAGDDFVGYNNSDQPHKVDDGSGIFNSAL